MDVCLVHQSKTFVPFARRGVLSRSRIAIYCDADGDAGQATSICPSVNHDTSRCRCRTARRRDVRHRSADDRFKRKRLSARLASAINQRERKRARRHCCRRDLFLGRDFESLRIKRGRCANRCNAKRVSVSFPTGEDATATRGNSMLQNSARNHSDIHEGLGAK